MRTHCRRCGGIINTERPCKKCGSERHILPSAIGEAQVSGDWHGEHREAHKTAYEMAVINFKHKYNREPTYDILCFRGAHTTLKVVLEIWEEA